MLTNAPALVLLAEAQARALAGACANEQLDPARAALVAQGIAEILGRALEG